MPFAVARVVGEVRAGRRGRSPARVSVGVEPHPSPRPGRSECVVGGSAPAGGVRRSHPALLRQREHGLSGGRGDCLNDEGVVTGGRSAAQGVLQNFFGRFRSIAKTCIRMTLPTHYDVASSPFPLVPQAADCRYVPTDVEHPPDEDWRRSKRRLAAPLYGDVRIGAAGGPRDRRPCTRGGRDAHPHELARLSEDVMPACSAKWAVTHSDRMAAERCRTAVVNQSPRPRVEWHRRSVAAGNGHGHDLRRS